MNTHAQCRLLRKIELQIANAVRRGELSLAEQLARHRTTSVLTRNERETIIQKNLSRGDVTTAADAMNDKVSRGVMNEVLKACLEDPKQHFLSLVLVTGFLKRKLTDEEKKQIRAVCRSNNWTEGMIHERFGI